MIPLLKLKETVQEKTFSRSSLRGLKRNLGGLQKGVAWAWATNLQDFNRSGEELTSIPSCPPVTKLFRIYTSTRKLHGKNKAQEGK